MHNLSKHLSAFLCKFYAKTSRGEIRLSLPSSSLQIDLFENVLKVDYSNSIM